VRQSSFRGRRTRDGGWECPAQEGRGYDGRCERWRSEPTKPVAPPSVPVWSDVPARVGRPQHDAPQAAAVAGLATDEPPRTATAGCSGTVAGLG
jgi:hypothetical protein